MAVRMAHRPTSWRTVFVSPTLPTLLMLPGVIVVVALPARVRANPASGTRPSSAGSSLVAYLYIQCENYAFAALPLLVFAASKVRREPDFSRADASTRPEMDQNPE